MSSSAPVQTPVPPNAPSPPDHDNDPSDRPDYAQFRSSARYCILILGIAIAAWLAFRTGSFDYTLALPVVVATVVWIGLSFVNEYFESETPMGFVYENVVQPLVILGLVALYLAKNPQAEKGAAAGLAELRLKLEQAEAKLEQATEKARTLPTAKPEAQPTRTNDPKPEDVVVSRVVPVTGPVSIPIDTEYNPEIPTSVQKLVDISSDRKKVTFPPLANGHWAVKVQEGLNLRIDPAYEYEGFQIENGTSLTATQPLPNPVKIYVTWYQEGGKKPTLAFTK